MGETILGNSFALGPGGKGSNQSVAAARAGGDVTFITRLGDDDFAKIAHGVWAGAGVKPSITVDHDSYTGAAFIFIEAATGDNAIIVAPGAAGRVCPADVDARADMIASAGVFVTQLEQPLPAAKRGLEIARNAGVTTILNPAPAAALGDDILSLCDYLTPNETEAAELSGIPVTDIASAEAACDALMARGVGAVVLTMGAQGVLYRDKNGSLHVPAISAGPVVETTGAGDAFNGAFAVALSEGKSVAEALRFGCAGAGISVTRPGAAASMPVRHEIDAQISG
jgi:ribokinase